jgi:hypothetical protein
MLRRILLLLIVALLGALIYFSATSKIVKDFKTGKDINVLFMLDEIENNDNIKFFVAKYNSSNEHIKVVFINEDVTILYKTKKARILKDMILETKPENRIDFIKKEAEQFFDSEFNIDYYVCLNNKSLENIINVFSKKEDLETNLKLFGTMLQKEIYRDTNIVATIKVLNYIYNNFNRFSFIKFIKELYSKNIVIKTNFEVKDLFLLYAYFLDEDKIIKYADVPTVSRRKRIEIDTKNKEKIGVFLNRDTVKNDDYLKIEVLNTTNKSRLAIKAVDKIRENNFDVVDWGASSKKYEFTTIYDLVDNYEQVSKIKNILNCGEIIFKPQERPLADVSVFLGQDCTIYDKLDREAKD